MIYGVYSIRDVKTGFMRPSIELNDQAAARNFSHAVVNSADVLSSFAPDFDLYRVADFDGDSGEMIPCQPIRHVISGPDAFRLLADVSPGGAKDA